MILKSLTETSVFAGVSKKSIRKYYSFEEQSYMAYKNSQIYRVIQGLWDKTKISFRYSFLARVAEIEKGNNILIILDNSRFITRLLNIYNSWRYKIINYFKRNAISDSKDIILKELQLFPVKIGGIVLITAVITDILLSILFNKKIGFLSWVIRISFLFIGLSGLFCNATWEDMRRSSCFLKRIKNL